MADPILGAIAVFRAGIAVFNHTPSELMNDEVKNRITSKTYGPPLAVRQEWGPTGRYPRRRR